VLCFCFLFLHLAYTMLPVVLDCPFLITPSVFSNVYLMSSLHKIYGLHHERVDRSEIFTCQTTMKLFPLMKISSIADTIFTGLIYISKRRVTSYLPFRSTCVHLQVYVGSVLLVFLVFCVVPCCLSSSFVLGAHCRLCFWIDSPFSTAPSVFSNVYFSP
jgi:hypothetical protein